VRAFFAFQFVKERFAVADIAGAGGGETLGELAF